jgi:hypothetical protein
MSLIFLDSLSRYGATDAVSAASNLSRYGWSSSGNIHNKTGGHFGANHLQQSGGAQGSKTAYWSAISRTIVPTTSLGVSLKCSPFLFADAGNGTTRDYLFLRVNLSNGHYIDLNLAVQEFHNNTFITNSVWTTTIYAMYFTYNGTAEIRNPSNNALPGRRIDFSSQTATVYSRPSSRDSMWTANFSTINWMHLDFLFNTTTKIFSARLVSHDNNVFTTTTADPSPRYGTTPIPDGMTITSVALYGNDFAGMKMSDLLLWTQNSVGLANFPDNPRQLRVQRIIPSNNGSLNNWTPSSGSNFSTVNETPYSDTQFSAGIGSGTKQTFVMSGLGTETNSIKSSIFGVQLNPNMLDAGGEVSQATPIQIIDSTETSMSSGIIPSRISYLNTPRIITTNPVTSAPYTASQINSAEIGFNVS